MGALSAALQDLVGALVAAARFVASFGTTAALVLGGVGLALLAAGHRAFRPAAALVAGTAAALGALMALAELGSRLPVSQALAVAGAAVVGAALGLVWPALATVLASGSFGLAAGRVAAAAFAGDREVVLLGACLAGALVAGILWTALPMLIPPVTGGALVSLGAWAVVLSTRPVPRVGELPAVWLALFGVLAVVGTAVEKTRTVRRETASVRRQAKTDADAARRREEEQRERYARFFK